MNLKERKKLYNILIEEKSFSKYLANFSSWRQYGIEKVKPVDWLINKVYERYSSPIMKEEDPRKLIKSKLRGILETFSSYPLFFGAAITTFITRDLIYLGVAGPMFLYLNWRGEAEWMSSSKRIEELGLKREEIDEIIDSLFKRR